MTEYRPRHQQVSLLARVRQSYRGWSRGRRIAIWCVTVFAAIMLIGGIGNAVDPLPAAQPVSTVQAMPRVPDVRGMPQADALKLLECRGFTAGVLTPVEHGTILWVHDQSPEPGEMASPGSAVSLRSTPDNMPDNGGK